MNLCRCSSTNEAYTAQALFTSEWRTQNAHVAGDRGHHDLEAVPGGGAQRLAAVCCVYLHMCVWLSMCGVCMWVFVVCVGLKAGMTGFVSNVLPSLFGMPSGFNNNT